MRYVVVTPLDTQPRKKSAKILKIIDKLLKQVYGEEATLFVYKYLEQRYSLRQSDFSEKMDVFAKGLEDCLSSGAFAIEEKILDDVYSIYGTFWKTEFEMTTERYNFTSQMKITLRSA
jgi:hypothetical protein